MKKLILLIPILLTVTSACTKKYCYKCSVKITTIVDNGTPNKSETSETICNATSSEIRDKEIAGTKDVTSGNTRIISQTSCDKD